MSTIRQLLRVARLYGDALSLPSITVSSRVFRDSKKLTALESGADITVTRAEAAMEWFSVNWPAEATWPEDVPRPGIWTAPTSPPSVPLPVEGEAA